MTRKYPIQQWESERIHERKSERSEFPKNLDSQLNTAATTPSSLGGGNHGHTGIIVEVAKYMAMTGGNAFLNPSNPGLYPNTAANATAGTRAREEAIHKGLVQEYEIFCGVKAGLKDIILGAVDSDYVLAIKDKILRFLNQTPMQIIAHLRN